MNKTGTNKDLPKLQTGRVHELSGESAVTFAFLMAKKGELMICGAPYWVSSLHPESVSRFFDPNFCLQAMCHLYADVLWAAENALRSGCIATVLIALDGSPSLTNFRRLQLAAQCGGSLGLAIVNRPAPSSAAETRWHCTPAYSEEQNSARIHASLYKNKRGLVGSWLLDVSWEKDCLHMDAAPAGEPVWPERIAG
jgi:protein ImuA